MGKNKDSYSDGKSNSTESKGEDARIERALQELEQLTAAADKTSEPNSNSDWKKRLEQKSTLRQKSLFDDSLEP